MVTGLEDFLTKAAASDALRGASSAAAAFGDRQRVLNDDQALDVDRPLHWRRCQWPGQGAVVAYSAALAAAMNGTVLRLHRARGAAGKAGAPRPTGLFGSVLHTARGFYDRDCSAAALGRGSAGGAGVWRPVGLRGPALNGI